MDLCSAQLLESFQDRADRPEAFEMIGHPVVRVEKRPFIILLARFQRQLPEIEMDPGRTGKNAPNPRIIPVPPVYGKPEIDDFPDGRPALVTGESKHNPAIEFFCIAKWRRQPLPKVPAIMVNDEPPPRGDHLPEPGDAPLRVTRMLENSKANDIIIGLRLERNSLDVRLDQSE
jgi:hypothetical protein